MSQLKRTQSFLSCLNKNTPWVRFLLCIVFLLALPLVCIGPCLHGDGGGNMDRTEEKILGSINSFSGNIIYL